MKNLMIVASLLITTTFAQANNIPKKDRISSFKVYEVPMDDHFKMAGGDIGGLGGGTTGTTTGGKPATPTTTPTTPTTDPGTDPTTPPDATDKFGRVISTARDIVALGEAMYELVKKGKPSNTTEYAPISVVPKDPVTHQVVEPFDLENFSMPVKKKFVAVVKNGSGKEVVRFEYMVIYSYGGSYNGTGKYITGAMIQPVSIKTNFGWDLTATMKLGGIMNHGTRANPVAGVILTMKYQMNSWSKAFERQDTLHITGRGELKSY
jgi:hypothetical protein